MIGEIMTKTSVSGATQYVVPFNRPALAGRELEYVREAIENRRLSGDGPFTARVHRLLEAILGVPRTLLTTSCTDALEMAALLLDLQPGDEVVLPAFTFVSTANAFVLRGARPVFCDVRPDTLNLDETRLPECLTPRTRAVVVVHYAGIACEMDGIARSLRGEISLVEDNAHGLLGTYRGRLLGTFGRLSTLSFHETKNFVCGEGGALIVNDRSLVARAEIIREKGTNRSQFLRGEVDKYTWIDTGSSFLPSDMVAAFLYGQLEARTRIQESRRRIWEGYHTALAGWAARNGVKLPHVPDDCGNAYHLYFVVMPSAEARTRFIHHMRGHGVQASSHYVPLNSSPHGQRLGGRPGACPVAESASERLVRLPLYASLTISEQELVVDAVLRFTT